MEATQQIGTVSSFTSLTVDGAARLERESTTLAPPARFSGPVEGRHHSEFEAVGLLIGVLSVLLALAVGLGVTPGS